MMPAALTGAVHVEFVAGYACLERSAERGQRVFICLRTAAPVGDQARLAESLQTECESRDNYNDTFHFASGAEE